MLANYLIGLREGLEATLVVSILIAYLVKIDQRALLSRIWTGVAAAIGVCVAVASGLFFTDQALSERAAEIFAGITSLLAAALITWMIFWMAKHARTIRQDLENQVDRALSISANSLIALAFFAVVREGLETALFLFSGATSAAGDGSRVMPLLAALAGIASAVVLGAALYRGLLRVDLRKIFLVTGAVLVVVAAGILAYGVHELEEVGLLPFLNGTAYDFTHIVAKDSVLGTLMRGILNIPPSASWLTSLAWLTYLVPTMFLFWKRCTGQPKARTSATEQSQPKAELVS